MNTNKISAGTIVRTICLILALINQLLSASGHAVLPIEDAQIETLVTTVITIVMALIGWWKNNSFTKAAIQADAVLKEVKEAANGNG